jgi:hypothetical protein
VQLGPSLALLQLDVSISAPMLMLIVERLLSRLSVSRECIGIINSIGFGYVPMFDIFHKTTGEIHDGEYSGSVG